jgi:hypothetical protein
VTIVKETTGFTEDVVKLENLAIVEKMRNGAAAEKKCGGSSKN